MPPAESISEQDTASAVGTRQRLGALAALFLRLGIIGFGGPLAHIGLMEDLFIARRKWATREQFLEGLAICNLLPGPTSTQLSMYLGYLRAGVVGGVVSGTCFIGPAFLLVLGLAWAYVRYGALPQVGALFLAIGPVVIAIIANTLYRTGKTALTSPLLWVIALSTCTLTLYPLLPPGINLVVILLASGLVGVWRVVLGLPVLLLTGGRGLPRQPRPAHDEPTQPDTTTLKSLLPAPLLALKALSLQAAPSTALLLPLALVFLKIGLLMFGGGLVVAPLLQQELVDGPHWLTTRQLVDGLALGQLTPGPVSVVATFAGFAVAGFPGGVVATVAVFLPSFVLVLGLTPLLLRRYRSAFFTSFLRGVTAGALGTIAGAAILFGYAAITDLFTAAIALVSLALLLRWNINTTYLILGAAVLGIGRALLGL
ncbi:MAG TPA: chromate efflux transporter [Ktedonobacterales bacterium]|jgi:chromate transporter